MVDVVCRVGGTKQVRLERIVSTLAEVHGKVTKDTGALFGGGLQQQMRPRDVRDGATRNCGKNLVARCSGKEPVLGGAEVEGWNGDGVEEG